MNPCINCPLDSQGCHSSGFAAAKCDAWIAWKTSLLIFKAECRLRIRPAYRINPFSINPARGNSGKEDPMSSTFDTLCHALRTISTQDNLTTRQKDILSYVLDLTEEMHSANHRLEDVINKDLDVSLAARRLRIVLDTEDPELQRQKLLQTYQGGKP